MRSGTLRTIGILILACCLLLGFPAPTMAQGESATPGAESSAPQFGIFPIGDYENRYIQVEIDPGETMELSAGVINIGAEPVALRTFATNAYNPPNGGFAAGAEEDELAGPTLWLDYPSKSFELTPDEVREFDFTVTVPADTQPGLYVAALVVRTEGDVEVEGSEIFRQVIRGAMSVEIMVPGPMHPAFELGEPTVPADTPAPSIDIPVINTGNTLVKPAGELTVTSTEGETILTSDIEMGSVYGNSQTILRVGLPDRVSPGDYTVSVSLKDSESDASASIDEASITVVAPEIVEEELPTFVVDEVSITPNDDPVIYANVIATVANNGPTIPTASITLNVYRDGEEVESYPLAQNQSLPDGTTEFNQRYIPLDDWQSGTWTFQLVIASVEGGTETILATIDVEDEIVVP